MCSMLKMIEILGNGWILHIWEDENIIYHVTVDNNNGLKNRIESSGSLENAIDKAYDFFCEVTGKKVE